MDLRDVPPVDVRAQLTEERRELLHLLGGLSTTEWAQASGAPGWRVKDLALHILDDDLGELSRARDNDPSGLLQVNADFVEALAAKNQRFIDGNAGMSPRVLIDLLRWAGEQMDEFYAALDLQGDGYVVWASSTTVPLWFDIAQDLTERWVHQQQIRDAIGRPGNYAATYLPIVLETFVWAFPHQYRAPAATATVVTLDFGTGREWFLVSSGTGWELEESAGKAQAAALSCSPDAAWRLLTGAPYAPEAVSVEGDPALTEPLLAVRGIIV